MCNELLTSLYFILYLYHVYDNVVDYGVIFEYMYVSFKIYSVTQWDLNNTHYPFNIAEQSQWHNSCDILCDKRATFLKVSIITLSSASLGIRASLNLTVLFGVFYSCLVQILYMLYELFYEPCMRLTFAPKRNTKKQVASGG